MRSNDIFPCQERLPCGQIAVGGGLPIHSLPLLVIEGLRVWEEYILLVVHFEDACCGRGECFEQWIAALSWT